jgi:hypothetical protein
MAGGNQIEGDVMASEARIVINGQILTDQESMTVRLAVDALANILGEGVAVKKSGVAASDAYMTAISRVRKLLGSGISDAPSVN